MEIQDFEDEVGDYIANEFYKEMDRSSGDYQVAVDSASTSHEAINDGFDWEYSKKGREFWYPIYGNLSGMSDQPLPEPLPKRPTTKRIKQPLWVRCAE